MAGWGRPAYEAYFESCGGKSIHGEDLPSWEDQSPEIRRRWEAAGDGVYHAVMGLPRPGSVHPVQDPEGTPP